MRDYIIEFKVLENDELAIRLKEGTKLLDEESLTIGQDFDNMLIKALDKLLAHNKIEKLRIKSVKIAGKTRPSAISTMIAGAVKNALET